MKSQRIARKAWWGALAAVCLVYTSIPVAFAQSKTAQSIMVSVTPSTTALEIEGEITWTYQRDDCAVTYYTANAGVWNGATPTCSGSAVNCSSYTGAANQACCSQNQPALPAAPAVPTTGPNSVSPKELRSNSSAVIGPRSGLGC